MRSIPGAIEFKNLSIFDTDFRDAAKTAGVFGIGKNSYSPSTNVLDIKIFSEDRQGILASSSDIMPIFSPVYQHENGHSMLTDFTPAGFMLQNVISLRSALCQLVLDKMLKYHGRIWIPVTGYLKTKEKDEYLASLIRHLDKLLSLEKSFYSGWKVGQELFSLYYTIWAVSNASSSVSLFLKFSDLREMFEHFQYLMLLKDTFTVERIVEKFVEYLTANNMDLDTLSEDDISALLGKAEEIFPEEELQKIFKGFISVSKVIKSGSSENSWNLDRFYEMVGKEQFDLFESCGREHLEALQAFMNLRKQTDNSGIRLFSVLFPAFLFAPRINPERFLSEKRQGLKFKSIDDVIAGFYGSKLFRMLKKKCLIAEKFFNDPGISKRIYQEINSVIRKAGWVSFGEKESLKNIGGTQEWAEEVIRIISGNKADRTILEDSFRSYKTPRKMELLISNYRLCRTLLFLPHRLLFRFAITAGRIISKIVRSDNPSLINGLAILDNLKLNSSANLARAIRMYLMHVPVSLIWENGVSHDITYFNSEIFRNKDGLKFAIPTSEKDYLNYHFRSYLTAELANICINGFQISPFVCPCGKLLERINENNPDSTEPLGGLGEIRSLFQDCGYNRRCRIKMMFSALDLDESILLCASTSTVQFIKFKKSCESEILLEMPFSIFFTQLDKNNGKNKEDGNAGKKVEAFKDVLFKNIKKGAETDANASQGAAPPKDETADARNRAIFWVVYNQIKEQNHLTIESMRQKNRTMPIIFITLLGENLFMIPVGFLVWLVFGVIFQIPSLIFGLIKLTYKASVLPGKTIASIKIRHLRKQYETSIQRANKEFSSLISNLGAS